MQHHDSNPYRVSDAEALAPEEASPQGSWQAPEWAFILAGVLLLVTSALSLIYFGILVASATTNLYSGSGNFNDVRNLVYSVICVVLQLVIFSGGRALVTLKDYHAAWYGCFLAAVPCAGLFAFPIGVVGILLLLPVESKAHFASSSSQEQEEERERPGSRTEDDN